MVWGRWQTELPTIYHNVRVGGASNRAVAERKVLRDEVVLPLQQPLTSVKCCSQIVYD
jgi:hypothetical protein